MTDLSKKRISHDTDFGIRVAVVVEEDGRILVVRHEKSGREPYFVLPGGRLEPGETIPECAVRELAEEANISVEFSHVLFVNEFLREGRHTVDITVSATRTDDSEASLGHDPEVAAGESPTLAGLEWIERNRLTSVGLLPHPVAQRLSGSDVGDGGSVYLDPTRA